MKGFICKVGILLVLKSYLHFNIVAGFSNTSKSWKGEIKIDPDFENNVIGQTKFLWDLQVP